MMTKKCGTCSKSIYYNDPQLCLGDKYYHKSCARCATCNGYLTVKNFSTSGDRLLCKTHFKEEFSRGGGRYAGDDKFKRSSSIRQSDADNEAVCTPVPSQKEELVVQNEEKENAVN